MKKSDDRPSNMTNIAKAVSILIQLGLTMFCTVLVAMLAGRFLDERLNTGNKITMVFMFLGLLAALRNMFVIVRNINR